MSHEYLKARMVRRAIGTFTSFNVAQQKSIAACAANFIWLNAELMLLCRQPFESRCAASPT